MKRIVCLQHDRIDGPGLINGWAKSRGHVLEVIEAGAPLQSAADDLHLLVILGGNASALDRTSRQIEERLLARAVASRGTGVLGLCLGAQMLALEFGGDVLAGAAPEHDWSVIQVDDEGLCATLGIERLDVFQAHNDAIRLPPGAALLASSKACQVQAFSGPGPVLGLQFHLEADLEKIMGFRALRGDAAVLDDDAELLGRCRTGLYRLLDNVLTPQPVGAELESAILAS